MTGDADEFSLHREMGCTRDEFVRWIPGATRHTPLRIDPDKAVVEIGAGTVEIFYRQAPPRRIALVSIPVLMVTFRFRRVAADVRRDFIAYFDLYTNRGGG